MDESENVVLATITITSELAADGDMPTTTHIDGDVTLVQVLGLLRLAEDTFIREAMGEVPDDGD